MLEVLIAFELAAIAFAIYQTSQN